MQKNANISYKSLRQTVGWLGMLLPLTVYLDVLFVGHCSCLQDSISHYYYTTASSWFVGILWGLGLVLIFYPSYKGEPNHDGLLTSIAGFCAILVSLFPTNPYSNDTCAIFVFPISSLRNGFHYACAGTMLGIFSYMSICIFTKTRKGTDLKSPKNKWKWRRNVVYIIAGCLTILSILSIGLFTLLENFSANFHIGSKYTYWLEVTALEPFGIAWIVKGGFVLTDDDETSTIARVKNIILRKDSPKPDSFPEQDEINENKVVEKRLP